MKCPICNYINSATRTTCKQCGNSFVSSSSTVEKIDRPVKADEKQVPYVARKKLAPSDSEIERIRTKLARIRELDEIGHDREAEILELSQTETLKLTEPEIAASSEFDTQSSSEPETLTPIEPVTLEPHEPKYLELDENETFSPKEIEHLSLGETETPEDIEVETHAPIRAAVDKPNYREFEKINFPLDERVKQVSDDIERYMVFYRSQTSKVKRSTNAKKNPIEISYDELMNSLPISEIEHELNPFIKSATESTQIEELYKLQLKELTDVQNNVIRNTEIKTSNTRSIDRQSLKDTYHSLKADLLAAEMSDQPKSEDAPSEVPVPGSRLIFMAFLLDLLFNLIFSFALVLSEKSINSGENLSVDYVLENLSLEFLENNVLLLIITFACSWCITHLLSLTLYQASLAQKILGMKISKINGMQPKMKSVYLRFVCQLLNVITLGIRPLRSLGLNSGLVCQISKTKLSFASFVE